MNSKSKRINALINHNEHLRAIRKDGRYAVAFSVMQEILYQDGDGELEETFIIQYGIQGMPYDHQEEFSSDQTDKLEAAIREFANLRVWRIDSWA